MSGEEIDLIVHGKELPVHIDVLIHHSPYFQRTLSPLVSDRSVSCIKLDHDTHDLSCIYFDTMKNIVQYFYSGILEVNEKNVKSILEAATILQLFRIMEPCFEYFKQDLKASNVIKRYIIVDSVVSTYDVKKDSNSLANIDGFLFDFIVLNFTHLAKLSQIYEHTTFEQFCRILDSPDLNVGSEMEIYEAILKWVNYYPYDRYYYFTVLLRNQLQWYCLKKEEFESLSALLQSETLLYDCYDYESITDDLLPQISNYHLLDLEEQQLFWKRLEYFNFSSKTWKILTNRPHIEYGAELCYAANSLFLIGGVQSKYVYKYDLESDSWDETFPMLNNYRVAHGVITHRNKIYVMGGSAKTSKDFGPGLNEMEVYDPEFGDWIRHESMTEGRSFLGAAVLDSKIYCTAGCLSEGHSSCEVYNLSKDQEEDMGWYRIKPTLSKRDSCGLLATHDSVYAIGGYDNNNNVYLKSVEAYEPNSRTWKLMKSMNYARRSPGVVFYRGKIWVFGGMGEKQDLRSIEVYNPLNNTWKMVDSKPKELSGWMRCCLIDMPLYMMKSQEFKED
ncbi:KLHL2_3 [Lepeophtheirus salmonis]|uniref:Kelch-like protein diablo n=1 Tax=Lepeophtheirus salmonis TaxID=72036 RepID=A0A7R8CB85_LEPSM|nr:KLHL2_3 [Lepeophtheirus salmonis]CAF2754051.1 KLHL2_3 [Lepeophtheirus salmonis]